MLDSKKLQQVAERRKVFTAYQLKLKLLEAGYSTSDSQVGRLWNGNGDGLADPKLSTVDKLCEVLKCKVGDITST